MIETFGDRIHFTHLRATCREENPKTFHEAAHLSGDVNMVAVVDAILAEEARRKQAGDLRLSRSARITDTRCWTICVRKRTRAIRRLAA